MEIGQVDDRYLPSYAGISIAFIVTSKLHAEPIDGGLGGVRLIEEEVHPPYLKDYDDLGEGGPADWPRRFDLRPWGIFLALDDQVPVGGAAVARCAPEIGILHGRDDLAAVWDIRVRPEDRGRGIGRRLFAHAAGWAREQGCSRLLAETQNTNVPACRFYAGQGCRIIAIDGLAYADDPDVRDETMLLWSLDL